MKRIKEFLRKKDISLSAKRYFVDAMGAMAQGLFATLLMGTILKTLGEYTNWTFLIEAAAFATKATGAVLGLSVAFSLKAPPLVLYSSSVVGLIGYELGMAYGAGMLTAGPAGSFLTVLVACEIGKIVSKETKIDIIVTPAAVILAGFGVAKLICGPIAWVMAELGNFINTATELQPVLMGIIISAVVGIILTLPISSAAICAMIGISGIAGGAAAAGCCAQMIGFAVISFKENKWGGLVAQGLGTSMLQMGNIVKNPRIWIPVTLASMITGPLASAVFSLKCSGVSAGMGTCGLVGPLGIISATDEKGVMFWVGLVLICFLLPAVLSLIFSEILRKIGWIKENDMKLDL